MLDRVSHCVVCAWRVLWRLDSFLFESPVACNFLIDGLFLLRRLLQFYYIKLCECTSIWKNTPLMSEYVKLWDNLEVWGKYKVVSYIIQHVSYFMDSDWLTYSVKNSVGRW
jgi:hypothetical protein